MKQFHEQGITGRNACIQIEAEGSFEVDESLLCFIKAIIWFSNR